MSDQVEKIDELAKLRVLAQEAFEALEKLNRLTKVVDDARHSAFQAVLVHREKNYCPTRLDKKLYRTLKTLSDETDKAVQEILGE